MLRRLYRFNRRAVIICAGVSHRRVVERAVTELDIPRRQVIGAAPAALQSALRAIVAVELRCPPGDVSLAVLGRPPEHLVIPWSEATVRGFALSRLLDAPALARLQAQARLVWPPGPYTLASATARLCETAIGHAGQKGLTCYTVLDGELGARGCAAAVTVELDAGGVTRIVEPSLGRSGTGAAGDGARTPVGCQDVRRCCRAGSTGPQSPPAAPAASDGPGAGVT